MARRFGGDRACCGPRSFGVVATDEVDPLRPFVLVGFDEGGVWRRELIAQGLVGGGDLGVECDEAWAGADGLLARGLGELAVGALGGGERREREREEKSVDRAHESKTQGLKVFDLIEPESKGSAVGKQ